MINHSGGCAGADMMWEEEGNKYGVVTLGYSFTGHHCLSKTPVILTLDELKEGFDAALKADITLKRNIARLNSSEVSFEGVRNSYVKNLVSRNWFQVKNADAVFAVGFFEKNNSRVKVKGGTGWAVQMAIDSMKPVYFYDQLTEQWHVYDHKFNMYFIPLGPNYIPRLTTNFAGIGSRDLYDSGRKAIQMIYINSGLTPLTQELEEII